MRAVLICTALVAAVLAQSTPAPVYPDGWVDLFMPPYQSCPQIMMSLACLSSNSCYIPGGSNGVGFNLFHFNGEYNGMFSKVNGQADGEVMMLMAIGLGGTAAQPQGLVGGMDFGAVPQYFVNATYVANSLTVPFVVTTQIAADRATGKNILFIDGFAGNTSYVMHSTDGGRTFTSINPTVRFKHNTCTGPLAIAMADANTWYIIGSSNPNPNKGSASSSGSSSSMSSPHKRIRRNDVVSAVWDDAKGKYVYEFTDLRKVAKENAEHEIGTLGCPYYNEIIKTADGGSTWTSVFSHEGEYALGFIDCADANHCVATGAGYNATQSVGAVILTTTDGGQTWNKTLNLPSNSEEIWSVSAVQYVPGKPSDVWVAANLQSSSGMTGYMYYSSNSGRSWVLKQKVDFIGAFTDMSFANDGTGFATGITVMQDSTVVRYSPNGPAYTPAPPYNGNFTQTSCPGSGDCSTNCTSMSFPQNTCLPLNGGGSAIAQCDMTDNVLIQNVFILSNACQGPAEQQLQPLDQCLMTQDGTLKTVCGGTGASPSKPSAQKFIPFHKGGAKKKN